MAIDRATRMIFYWIYENKNAKNAEDFLEKCLEFFPFKIEKILTDKIIEERVKDIFKNKNYLFNEVVFIRDSELIVFNRTGV